MPAPSAGVFAASVISVLILLLWALQLATLADLGGSDAAGNALAQAYAVIEIFALWIMLAVLLIVCGVAGGMAWQAAVAAVVLLPASGFAVMTALDLLADTRAAPYLWPIIVPALVPPVVVAFAVWMLLPALRAAIPAGVASGAVWGITLVLSVAVWPMVQARDQVAERVADQRAQWASEFARLAPDAPLWQWTPFLDTPDNTRQAAVLDGIRMLTRRQADAETMLDRDDFPLGYLARLDLDPTQSLCEKARASLRRRVQRLLSDKPGTKPYAVVAEEVQAALAAMKWLVGYGCSCDAESRAWEAMANGYRDPNFDVVELAELRDPAALGRTLLQDPARFSMLTSKAHLRAWLKFADDRELRQQALAGARGLDHRTGDAVEMLEYDEFEAGTVLRYMPVLDLEATEPLCRSTLKVLGDQLARIYRPRPDDPRSYQELLSRLGRDAPLTALQWAAAHGCDAGPLLDRAEQLVRSYQDAPERAAMLASLGRLHHTP